MRVPGLGLPGGWWPALRIARREVRRARGRSLLVFVMVALPVLGIVALDTLARTVDISAEEALPRTLGRSDAVIWLGGTEGPVVQAADAIHGAPTSTTSDDDVPPATEASLTAALPAGSRLLPVRTGSVGVRTPAGQTSPLATEVDLTDPLTTGLQPVLSGRLPQRPGEVAVTEPLARRGFRPGADLTLASGTTLRVVGRTLPPPESGGSAMVGLPGTFGLEGPAQRWLVDAPRDVAWSDVRRLNGLGAYVVSRAVILDPPPDSAVPAEARELSRGADPTGTLVLALVVAMVLLETALLAGPAFAVGARRQRRSLALLAAAGGAPRHVGRVVLAQGLVLGAGGSIAGAALGLLAAWLAVPAIRDRSGEIGPYEVSARDVVLVLAFGTLSALLAALAPAHAAARQDVVATLAGRRGQTGRSIGSLVVGLVLLAVGVVGAIGAATATSGGELLVALAAVPSVLGAALLAPALLGQLARVADRLPLPVRFALRDAARQRGRTAPAVAAVTAVVAGVVALAVGGASDAAEDEATHQPIAPAGTGVARVDGADERTWDAVRRVLNREVPEARVLAVRGVLGQQYDPAAPTQEYERAVLCRTAEPCDGSLLEGTWSAAYGTEVLVGPKALSLLGLAPEEVTSARRTLDRGGIVTWSARPLPEQVVLQRLVVTMPSDGGEEKSEVAATSAVPVLRLEPPASPRRSVPAQLVLSPQAAARVGLVAKTSALVVDGAEIPRDAEDRIRDALAEIDDTGSFAVERGYSDRELRIALLLLGSVAGVLVLGGTLTATLLALSDARPDLATLMGVGGAPRTRRLVAASYAAVIGLLGAVLGAVAGLVPGIAVAFPLTRQSQYGELAPGSPEFYVDVPWLFLGALVVGVPLVAVLGVGLFTRSRLPLVARQPA